MNWYLKVLKQYADFNGRARRKEYWMFFLVNIIISYSLNLGGLYLNLSFLTILSTIYSFAVLIPGLAVAVRRMHDVGKDWWYIFIPIYNLILLCTDSEPGPNEWGDNPKGIGNDRAIDQIGVE